MNLFLWTTIRKLEYRLHAFVFLSFSRFVRVEKTDNLDELNTFIIVNNYMYIWNNLVYHLMDCNRTHMT